MSGVFIYGALLVALGLFVCLFEIIWEPWFVKGSPWIQTSCFALLIVVSVAFLIGVVGAKAPIMMQAFTRPGDDGEAAAINEAHWDNRLTDLHFVLSNPLRDDYQRLDVSFFPGQWVHRAAIMDGPSGCELKPKDGGRVLKVAKTPIKTSEHHTFSAVPSGAGADIYDSAGNAWESIASESGYRLICPTFPGQYTISLGVHLKTGHTWPLQNRPTELNQDKSIYNPPTAISANIFRNPA